MMRPTRIIAITMISASLLLVGSQVYAARSPSSGPEQPRILSVKQAGEQGSGAVPHLAALGITVVNERPASPEEVAVAQKAASASFGFLDDAPIAVEEVSFTDDHYGKEDDKTGVVDRYYVNRDALMIVLEHQKQPLFGAYGAKDLPQYIDSTFVGFVDGATGEILRAVTFGDDVLPPNPQH